MNSTAVQYAGALRHAGCTLSELRRTAGCLTGCAELWDALCSPAVSAREKKAVLARLPAFDARGELRHFYLLLADKNRFALLPEIVRAVTFEIVTDETLLGGFTAEIDGVTYDKSVRGQLRALAHDL